MSGTAPSTEATDWTRQCVPSPLVVGRQSAAQSDGSQTYQMSVVDSVVMTKGLILQKEHFRQTDNAET